MRPWPREREFAVRDDIVAIWPDPGESPAFVDIIYTVPGGKDLKWRGRATTSLDEAISALRWIHGQPDTVGIYACLSTQRQAISKTASNGRPYHWAIRNQANAVALKSLFIDIDTNVTKQDGKGYEHFPTAMRALAAFIKATGLPPPNVVVGSGGGMHVYWVMSRALTVQEWKPLAFALAEATKRQGLKCDPQCTIDSARVLRIPNTMNKEVDPPLPVTLLRFRDGDYSVEQIAKSLEPYKVAAAAPAASFLENPAVFTSGPSSCFADIKVEDELGAGVEPPRLPPPKLDDLVAECPFVRESIATGGASYSQPLWMMTTLLATFTEGGRADAHQMANKHPGYSKESTDELFDRKEREKAEKGVGWPSCNAISGFGCTACQTCPHFAAGESPLHFVLPAKVTASVPPPTFADPWAEFVGPAFPVEILPPPLAKFVDAQHRAMGADGSALGMATLTAVAGAIDAETCLRMGSGWSERPLLWTALVGSPSSMKSPVMDKASARLRKIDHDRDATWRQNYSAWKQSKSAGANPGPPPPKQPRKVVQDVTPEKLAEILARDPSGTLMLHDELAGLIASFDRYGSGAAARSFHLTCWNGGPFLKDRVGQGARDENAEIRVDNGALCILGGIQPDRLAQLKDLTSDGLLQRYLLIGVQAPARGDEDYPSAAAEQAYANLIQSIHGAVARTYTLSPDAVEVRRRVLDRLHDLEQSQGFAAALIGAIGKMRGYYGRLALTLHIANEHAAALSTNILTFGTSIPKETAEAAEKLLFDFLLPHIFGVYDVIADGGKHRETVRTIAGFILADDKDRIRRSDFSSGVRKIRYNSQKEIAEWASRFCAMGWLRPEDENAPVPKAWTVVPGLRERFAERRKQVQRARAEAHAILSAGATRG